MQEDPKPFRDHFLSIFQSAASDYVSRIPEEESAPGAGLSTGRRFMNAVNEVAELRAMDRSEVPTTEESAVDITKICASLGFRYLQALSSGEAARAERIKEQMTGGTCDPQWASTLSEYAKFFGVNGTQADIPYVRPSIIGDRTIPINAGCRVAVFGDWGTGAGPARRVLSMIRDQNPDILVHLGDIYYSGTPKECTANFKNVIKGVFGNDSIPTFTLAGNHDMYCGGLGYYGLVDAFNSGDKQQKSSFFCLRTEDKSWQLLAMDTGLHDYSPLSVTDALTYVEEDEQVWLEKRVREFNGRTILLSHHQLFSAFSQIGKPAGDGRLLAYNPNLLILLRKLQAAGEIAAWFWGHEHNLCIYDPFLNLDRGRCVGHGAIPIFAQEKPYTVLQALSDAPTLMKGTELQLIDGAYEHGFAIISLGRGKEMTSVEYFGEDGKSFAEEF